MIDGIRVKVCGLTSLVDADFADRCGVDYLGFNLYPKSPRYLPLAQFRAMAPRLPERKRVAIMVTPTSQELREAVESGFDYYQIHFPTDTLAASITSWSETVGRKRLWLAPKLPPADDVSAFLLPLAKFFLLDTFHAEKFGGSGQTSDWTKFSRHQAAHTNHFWILSGGLNPENIGDAMRTTGARFVDVNSGIEAAPGVKDQEKLKRFIVRLHESQA